MNTRQTLALALAVAFATASQTSALETFRGIQKDQASVGLPDNRHSSPSMDRINDEWYVDIQDNFGQYPSTQFGAPANTRSRTWGDPLMDTFVDTHRIGFVPPTETDENGNPWADGELPDTSTHGMWHGTELAGDYVLSDMYGGSVRRLTGNGTAVVCTDWAVTDGLGDDYLYEATVILGDGADNHLTMGFMGDESLFETNANGNTNDLRNSPFGQLVLDVERDGQQIDWEVSWDIDGARPRFSGTLTGANGDPLAVGANEELRLMLGWDDQPNTWDAWVEVAGQMFNLVDDIADLGAPIEVFGVAFQTDGTDTYITGHLAAIPEPGTGVLMALGMISCLAVRSRKRQR